MRHTHALFVTGLLLACSEHPAQRPLPSPDASLPDARAADGSVSPGRDAALEQPSEVSVAPLAADQAAYSALGAQASAALALDATGLRASYPTSFRAEPLSYDPDTAASLDRIQASRLALTEGERAKLGANGFVISGRSTFPTFLYGLSQIYSEHLPLHVTADSLLEAVHSSYDQILATFERNVLFGQLQALLTGMRGRLATLEASAATKADLDMYLGVAQALLVNQPPTALAGGDLALMKALYGAALEADGLQKFVLFGTQREEDFSQFEPRGHYENDRLSATEPGTPSMPGYFRANIWLGRFDLRLLETTSASKQVFHRQQYLAMLAMRELIGSDIARFAQIDGLLRSFVGKSDYMVPEEVDQLVAALGGAQAAAAASDEAVAKAIIAGDYGKQLIASHISYDDASGTLPLNRSFALLGQRYVVDSQVFSDSTDDRVRLRMMPTPLDAAFAALGNSQALALHPQLDFPGLAGALGRSRVVIDAHDGSFWGANLYNLWLSALRALSPAATPGLPELFTTEAWGRRMLNTQLGSWSELRHDTLLYAKQSYSGIPVCEYPDAYVDPYPAFYRALVSYADTGARLIDLLGTPTPAWAQGVTAYFDRLKQAASSLEDMAKRELRGEPFSAEQLQYLNDAVRIERVSQGCASVDVPDGWYAELFFSPDKSLEFDPTIADVHTQPADEFGNIVGKVLHVGTGYPRFMVTTVDTCTGPRAYTGVVYAYHEKLTDNFERLTDSAWSQQLQSGDLPADVPWMSDLLAR